MSPQDCFNIFSMVIGSTGLRGREMVSVVDEAIGDNSAEVRRGAIIYLKDGLLLSDEALLARWRNSESLIGTDLAGARPLTQFCLDRLQNPAVKDGGDVGIVFDVADKTVSF